MKRNNFFNESEIELVRHPSVWNFKDMTGLRFTRLSVIGYAGKSENNTDTMWFCKCDCGKSIKVRAFCLSSGNTSSCGCLKAELSAKRKMTHGMSGSKTHMIWSSMIQRCHNPKNKRYHSYGGRGITVCERWHNFENFLEDMGSKPDGLSLDRKDNNSGYCKKNCRWATNEEQGSNRRNNRLLTLFGKTQTTKQWADELNIDRALIKDRLNKLRWSDEEALLIPSGVSRKNGQKFVTQYLSSQIASPV